MYGGTTYLPLVTDNCYARSGTISSNTNKMCATNITGKNTSPYHPPD